MEKKEMPWMSGVLGGNKQSCGVLQRHKSG